MALAPKHTVFSAISSRIFSLNHSALVVLLQHLFQMVSVFFQAQFGPISHTSNHGAARGGSDPPHRLFDGLLMVLDGFGLGFTHL